MVKKRGVGLVLGGGGARGFFHLGVIRALQELGIHVSEVSGASIGAVIGAVFCSDPSFDSYALMDDFSFMKVASISSKSSSLLDVDKIGLYIKDLLKVQSFRSLKIPLRITSTDLLTAEEVVLDSGRLVPAVLASMSIPGIFPIRKYRGRFLCDGGLVNNLPVSLLDAGKIIASDCTPPLPSILNMSSSMNLARANILVPQRRLIDLSLQSRSDADIVVFRMKENMEILDFRRFRIKSAVDQGYISVMENKALLKRFR